MSYHRKSTGASPPLNIPVSVSFIWPGSAALLPAMLNHEASRDDADGADASTGSPRTCKWSWFHSWHALGNRILFSVFRAHIYSSINRVSSDGMGSLCSRLLHWALLGLPVPRYSEPFQILEHFKVQHAVPSSLQIHLQGGLCPTIAQEMFFFSN